MSAQSSVAPVVNSEEETRRRRVREARKLSKGEEIFFEEAEIHVRHAFIGFFLGSSLAYLLEQRQSQESASATTPPPKAEPAPTAVNPEPPLKTPSAPTGSSSVSEGAVSVSQEATPKRSMPLTYAQRAAQASRLVPANAYASSFEQSAVSKLDSYKNLAESGLMGGAQTAMHGLDDMAKRIAYQGVHFMAVTTAFRAALAINKHVLERPKDPIAFGSAGAVAGIVHSCFLHPFSFRVMLARSLTLGFVGATGGLVYRSIQRRRERKLNGGEDN